MTSGADDEFEESKSEEFGPAEATLRCSIGRQMLLEGKFRQGLAAMEARHALPTRSSIDRHLPVWRGEHLTGQTLVIEAEQGFGDSIQFVRFAGAVKQRGARVVVRCPEPLLPLMAACQGVDAVASYASEDEIPEASYRIPMMSLPFVLGTTPDDLAPGLSYCAPRLDLINAWRKRLGKFVGAKVGLLWRGNPLNHEDAVRSPGLGPFLGLASVPGVAWFSLQKGPGVEELVTWPATTPVVDLGSELDDTTGAFEETAALLMALDLVITCDTAVAHLAGAVGRRAWVLLAATPDWRWGLSGERCDWYSALRLFRQPRAGAWEDAAADLKAALAKFASAVNNNRR